MHPALLSGVHLYHINVATHNGTTGLIESIVLLLLPESVDYQRFSDRPQSASPFRSSFQSGLFAFWYGFMCISPG